MCYVYEFSFSNFLDLFELSYIIDFLTKNKV